MSEALKLPPRIKVLEALGSLADGRMEVINDKEARVVSSDGSRTYMVYVDVGRREVDSTDNGTVYRGYVGYPIIAVLMHKGLLPRDPELEGKLKGLPWKKLNEEYKNYAKVMEVIFRERGIDEMKANKYIDLVLGQLRRMRLKRVHKYEVAGGESEE